MEEKLLTLEEICAYLRLPEEKIVDMAEKSKIPAVKVCDTWRFPKEKIDLWIEQQLSHEFAVDYEAMPEALLQVPLVNLIPRQGIMMDLVTTDKDKILQRFTRLAQSCGCIADPGWFYNNLKEREEIVSTAQDGGVAFIHTRHRNPRNILRPFILLGISREGVDWGAADGEPTRVFFTMGLRYDALHLKVLSQLARMVKRGLVAKLIEASTEDEIIHILKEEEAAVPRR